MSNEDGQENDLDSKEDEELMDFQTWDQYLELLYEEDKSNEDGEENNLDSKEENNVNKNDLINKKYIQEIIKEEVDKQVREALKNVDKNSSKKSESDESQFTTV